jgi:hypothetical protein
MSTDQESIIPRLDLLDLKDKQLFEYLDQYTRTESKEQRLKIVVDLLILDKTQTVLKHLSRESSSQTAFSFTLWLIDGDVVSLDWIYDMVYTISTGDFNHVVDLSNLYVSAKKLNSQDASDLVSCSESLLRKIRLDDLNMKDLAFGLDRDVAVSLLIWFLSFKKIAVIDLNYIAEISQKISRNSQGNQGDDAEDSQSVSEEVQNPKPQASKVNQREHRELEERTSFKNLSMEDMLVLLNLKLGGTEENILTRALDHFLFKKVQDADTGVEKVDFRPLIKVSQYFHDGKEKKELPMQVRSTKSWLPGVYCITKGADELKIMRLPANDYFEFLPDGPDPYLRALTIWSTLNQGNS